MISYLHGTILHKEPTYLILEVNQVGYQVESCQRIIDACGQAGEEVSLYTQLVVRENEVALYGFATRDEQKVFLMLQTVTGVGPRVALQVLEYFDPAALALAILNADIKALTACKGIGKKVAERMVLELKDKMEKTKLAPAADPAVTNLPKQESPSQIMLEVENALAVLGYRTDEIKKVTSEFIPSENDTVEIILRKILPFLAKF